MYNKYFTLRNVQENSYILPEYLNNILPEERDVRILDIGCGLGSFLQNLTYKGYTDLTGIDVSEEAISACLRKGLHVEKIESLGDYCQASVKRFDFIIMNHVLEHLEKDEIVETLTLIREHLLAPEGSFVLAVPNAQSNTGCYWAYEDFTHKTLFTTGSLSFVLRASGFNSVVFLDPDGVSGSNLSIKWLRILLLNLYKVNIRFWNLVTSSSFHKPSPQIFTYELKVLARLN